MLLPRPPRGLPHATAPSTFNSRTTAPPAGASLGGWRFSAGSALGAPLHEAAKDGSLSSVHFSLAGSFHIRAPIGLTDRGKSRSCERAEARRGKILDVSDRGATKARDANPRFPDGSQTDWCSSPSPSPTRRLGRARAARAGSADGWPRWRARRSGQPSRPSPDRSES